MDKLKAFWNWLATTSNPEKVGQWSLTLKAGIPTLVLFLGFFGFHIQSDLFSGGLDALATFVGAVATAVSAGITLYGFGRKILFTFLPPSQP